MTRFAALLALLLTLLLAACGSADANGETAGVTATGAASMVETTGADGTDVEATGVEAMDAEATDSEAMDVEPADSEPADSGPADSGPADVASADDDGAIAVAPETEEPVDIAPADTDASGLPPVDCLICDVEMASYAGPLGEDEVMGLLLALNDEYHAWAVYGEVIAEFGQVRPFTNIQRSEASHIAALERLFVAYELDLPANPWPGNVQSFASVTEACQVGVDAEIVNRELYSRLFASTDREDIISVYDSLQRASDENHLPAFERCAGR